MENKDLKEVYEKDELDFYPGHMESLMLIQLLASDTWEGKAVLEIGCGQGHLASMIHYFGAASVHATDFAEGQIEKAQTFYNKPGLNFECCDILENKAGFDVVVMQGVLEHLDDPFRILKTIMDKNLTTTGKCLLSVPNWSNPRGYIYHTCRILYGAKMSLTDLHFFTPDDLIKFAQKNGYKIEAVTTDIGLGVGDDMIDDLKRRIPLADPNIPKENVKKLMEFTEKLIPHVKDGDLSGATIGYKLEKMPVQGG